MANKTDRILGYLPSTFRAQPRPTALYSVIDAFGGELLGAENSLAAVMQAHWVDVADLGAEVLDDLGRFAALYGLGPRLDESVEEFREHLKRYVRTFLDGTVTVRGILRVTAEALGLHIDDDHLEVMGAAELHTVEPRGDDAAAAVLGVSEAGATGTPALPARLAGNVDLRGGVVLPPGAKLRLGVDGGQPVDVTLADRAAARSLDDLVHAVNEAMGAPVAEAVAGRLVLSSPTVGAAGRLAIPDVDGDAADAVLGLAPRAYRGSAARPARVVGTVHLGPTVDLHDERYLRVQIDGTHLAEVDCAGQDPAATLPTEVRDAVNAALGLDVAALDGDLLTLTSPTAGFDSRIDLLAPAAQDATARLLGTADRLRLGMDAQPARVIGRRDLSVGVDLRQAATIALRIDGDGPLSVDCARFAIDPAAARLPEIVLAMNTALGRQLASHDGRFLTVASAAVEQAGTVTLDTPATGDATAAVFGVGPREFAGADMTAARVTGRVDLGSGVDLRAQHLLVVAVDDRPPVAVDLRAGAAAAHAVTLTELAGAIDRVVGSDTGGREGPHLTITSPTTGPGSRVVVEPLEVSRSRRFVTRAVVVDDAAQVLLGYSAAAAMGTPATAARLVGTVDLNRGADLRDGSHLRLGVDGGPLLEVDCVGDRPRAVPLATVVTAVNDAFAPIGFTPAGDDGRHLVLTSPSEGGASRITVADSHELDAADRLLGVAPGTARGSDATAVRFTGTVDLGGGVDLEPDAAVSIGVDGAAPVEILLGRPATRGTQDELVAAVNAKLGAPIAGRNGTRLSLTSPTSGSGSRIEFAQPAGPDATGQVFGIPSGRSYHGAAGTQARITGVRDLSGPVDLSHTRFLRIAVDRQPPRSVDCAAGSGNAAAVLLGDIVTAINTGLGLTVASAEGSRLRLASPRTGAAGQLTLEAHTSDAARKRLLGTARQEAAGTAQAPAELVGAVALPGPVDLGERSVLRLAVDGHRPMEVDVAGAAPAGTFLDEVVAAVNAELPGVAGATDDGRLRLRSPTRTAGGRVAVLPLRTLQVVEYPAQPRDEPPRQLRHGDGWSVDNDGATEAHADIRVTAPRGAVGPGAVNGALGWRIRVLTVLAAGETLRMWRRPDGVLAAQVLLPNGGAPRAVPPAAILAGPLGAPMRLPAAGSRRLAVDAIGDRTLHLDDPAAPNVVRLRALRSAAAPDEVTVSAASMEPAGPDGPAGTAGFFDVRVRGTGPDGAPVEEVYPGVRVGAGVSPDSLVTLVNGGATPSRLVRAEEYAKTTALCLPLGPSGWRYLECPSSRFDAADFPARSAGEGARFSGGRCTEVGVFDVTCFADTQGGPAEAGAPAGGAADPTDVLGVFGSTGPRREPPAEVRVRWSRHEPGSFEVNLPADLAPRFGGRFGTARFAGATETPERYPDAVTEPSTDPRYLVTLIEARPASLLHAETATTVPIGFSAVPMPFRRPRRLTGGGPGAAARLYLAEPGIAGVIQLTAREPGAWGNDITVTARRAGPGTFDVTVAYAAARFENARQVVLGRSAGPSAAQLAEPGPVGVLQAKAAGVHAAATRDRTQPPPQIGSGGA